ncbi:MAG TPA: plastocyanin/azurin family copper-binding protein [Solirubrobacterales bacterium]|nr:plastocyanin/azurin family copper-binding protein [Solirubrobacterales bacterium]
MKKYAALFALLLAALALVACGGGDDTTSETTSEAPPAQENGGEKEAEGGSEGSGAAFDVEADPSGGLAYTTEEATTSPGNVTVNFTNSSPVPHDVRIEDAGGEDIGGTEVISESTESTKVDLKPGEYTFFCSVPGHRQGGMEGTLTVG